MNGALGTQARGLDAVRRPAARTPWLCVAGAKGGVGKTLIAVNLALQLQRLGHRTLLVDLDPGLGNVDVHLRLAPTFTVEDVAGGGCSARQALIDGPHGLQVLAGRSGSTLLTSDAAFVGAALDAVTGIATGFDVVVCDTGAGIGPAVLATACRADVVLAVTTPDPAAVTDTYALCKVLHGRGRPLPRLVTNRVRSRDEAMRTATRLGTVCQRFLGAELALAGPVTEDELLARSVLEQRPATLAGSGRAVDDLRALAANALALLPNGVARSVPRVHTAGRSAAG